jgi:large subunit ribosomal protein L37
VKNLYAEPVNDSQFESRALLKAFAVTSSYARKVFGDNARDLDHPVVLQTVHFDKQRIQFGLFQLNTLDLNSETKNYWFKKPIMELYEDCKYADGRPQLVNYNFNVFKTMCVLYGN